MYTISRTNYGASILYAQPVKSVPSKFETQEAIMQDIIRQIAELTKNALLKAFKEAKDEINQQAVIEATQELGHYDLAIQMMAQLD